MGTPDVWDMLVEELKMYRHHLSRTEGQARRGWMGSCVHSLLQQIFRADPLLYRTMVVLRSDRNHRLVSYPFAMRFTQPRDATRFRHLDQNPETVNSRNNCKLFSTVVTFSPANNSNTSMMLKEVHRVFPE